MGEEGLPFELDVMASAIRYQQWVFEAVKPHLGSSILEVGAGIGTMTRWLATHAPTTAIDIDTGLLRHLEAQAGGWEQPPERVATLDISQSSQIPEWLSTTDTIASFNVLEHIADDVGALRGMADVLERSSAPGRKRILIFVPAHQWAFGTVDTTFGHCRRYSKRSLTSLIRACNLKPRSVRIRYFNTVGLPGWILVGRVLRRPTFPRGSVQTMERIIPAVRRLDARLHGRYDLPLGQSVLAVIELG